MSGPTSPTRCDLILVSYNQLDYTTTCLESLIRSTPETAVDYRLLIIDNGSRPDVVAYLRGFAEGHPRVELRLNAGNLGWTKAVNQGIAWSTAPYVCWLNNNLVFMDGWLTSMLEVARADPRIGLVNPSWRLHHETVEVFRRRVCAVRPGAVRGAHTEVGECNGSCLLVRREVLDRVGGLDEAYESGGFDDSDLSRRAAREGFLCVQVHDAFVFHWENVTSGSIPGYWRTQRPQKWRLFQQRWGSPRTLAVVWDAHRMAGEAGARPFQVLVGLARLGLRVQVFVVGAPRRSIDQLKHAWGVEETRHANLKVRWFPWSSVLPCVGVVASHRGKDEAKRFKAVIAPSEAHAARCRAMRWLHGAPVHRSFATCPLLRPELERVLTLLPKQETLAAVVITKNEARQIEACLQTVAWVDERIVVDDESADGTPDICRRLGATVLTRASHGDFDGQRNVGIDQAQADWILQMDADERVPTALRLELELLLRLRPSASGFEVLRHNWFLGQPVRHGGWNGWGMKLFRKTAGRYVGCSVHETLRFEGARDRCEAPIEHYPYRSLAQVIDRTNFYSSVEARVLAQQSPPSSRRDLVYHLTLRPAKIFWKIYVKRRAYRDGMVGFVFSVFFSWSHWLTWAKYWERGCPAREH